jgi:hypothetical protein
MKFPKPTVDINEIRQKYHAIVEAEGNGASDTSQASEKKDKKHKKKKKGKQ